MIHYVCSLCQKKFERKSSYKNHCINIHPTVQFNEKLCKVAKVIDNEKKYVCKNCGTGYTRSDNLRKHIELKCKGSPGGINREQYENIMFEIKKLKEKNDYASKPIINNNHLYINCVGRSDDYIEILSERLGDTNLALNYIADCALSKITGDCKLLECIYFSPGGNPDDCAIRCDNHNRKNIRFKDKDTQRIVVDKDGTILGKRLGASLQKAYLGTLKKDVEKKLMKEGKPLYENFDGTACLEHVHELSEPKYQKALIRNLEIPSLIK